MGQLDAKRRGALVGVNFGGAQITQNVTGNKSSVTYLVIIIHINCHLKAVQFQLFHDAAAGDDQN